MGLKFSRQKQRNLLVSLLYKLDRLLPLPRKAKLRLYLDMEWVMWHFAHDYIYKAGLNDSMAAAAHDYLLGKVWEGAKVLDLGCGHGYVAERLLAKTNKILGIDYDRDSIEYAKGKLGGSGAAFLCDDIFNYLARNSGERFDVVVLSHVLEHIEEPEAFLKKINGVGDFFYIEVPDIEATHLNIYRQLLGTDLTYNDADHVHEFDREQLGDILRRVNLKVVDSEFRWGVMKYWCRALDSQVRATC